MSNFGRKIELSYEFIDIKYLIHYPGSEKMLLELFKIFYSPNEEAILVKDSEPLKAFSSRIFRRYKETSFEGTMCENSGEMVKNMEKLENFTGLINLKIRTLMMHLLVSKL